MRWGGTLKWGDRKWRDPEVGNTMRLRRGGVVQKDGILGSWGGIWGFLGGFWGCFVLLFLNGADLSSALLLGASVEGQLLRDK